ncbi:acetyl-coenzyme A synthetase, partial [bacterium]
MSETPAQDLSSLQKESEVFYPSHKALEKSIVTDFDALREEALQDVPGFWEKQAKELEWFEPWTDVVKWQPEPPQVEWFSNAKCNITVNALDRHVKDGKRNKVAFIWVAEEGEAIFKEKKVTYGELLRRVNQCANALKSMGVKKGDRVTIYMALTPALPIAMLACARIGAIHCVVYAGFSAPALRDRIENSGSKVVICSDMSYRRGKRVDLKGIVDEATRGLHSVEKVLVFRRGHTPIELHEPKEIDWDE